MMVRQRQWRKEWDVCTGMVRTVLEIDTVYGARVTVTYSPSTLRACSVSQRMTHLELISNASLYQLEWRTYRDRIKQSIQ